MAGHSKWANIKHRKGRQDAARQRVFAKLIREITIAARIGGADPNGNPRLRLAVDRASGANMPKDTMERAIKKGAGEGEQESLEEVVYEGYAPNGVAVMVEVITDNKNRTTPEIRHLFTKHGGNLGTDGCVAWMFETKGVIQVNRKGADEDRLMEIALEAGAEDVIVETTTFEVRTAPDDYEAVANAVKKAGFKSTHAEITRLPSTTVSLGEEEAPKVLKLLDMLGDHDDVQNVHSNFDVSDEVLEKLGS